MSEKQTTSVYDFKQNQQPEQHISHHKNGAIKEQCTVNADGQLHGPYLAYNEEGQVTTKAFFENDKLNGAYACYDDNGQVTTISHYKDGELDGETKIHDKGRLMMVAEYQQGKKHGKLSFYGANGKVTGEKLYKDDKQHGLSSYFNEQGEVVKTETYHEDMLDGPSSIYAFPPFPMERTYYKKDVPTEKITYVIAEGKDRGKYETKILFENGQPVGEPIPLDPETGAELEKPADDKNTDTEKKATSDDGAAAGTKSI